MSGNKIQQVKIGERVKTKDFSFKVPDGVYWVVDPGTDYHFVWCPDGKWERVK